MLNNLLIRACVMLTITSCLVLLSWAKSDSNENKKIEQCQCDALNNCRQEARKRHLPCVVKCRQKLHHKDWDEQAGWKCFEEKSNDEQHQCMHEVMLKTCALEPGVMLNKNETFKVNHRRHHRRTIRLAVNNDNHGEENLDEEENNIDTNEIRRSQHRPREHNRRAFHTFMRKVFGKSGNNFVKCMAGCRRHLTPDQCSRKLKCGVKRLPREQFHHLTAKCHKHDKPRRYEICNCIKAAGIKGLDCSFGDAKAEKLPESKNDEPGSTTSAF